MSRWLVVPFLITLAACGSDASGTGGGGTTSVGGQGGAGGQGGGEVAPLTIETDAGPVVGTTLGEAQAWLGIPYAAPPVGDLRWRSPAPVEPWTEPLDASELGDTCLQTDFLSGAVAPGGSEDCLSLNVFAPPTESEEPRPVMVWVHGGAFELGSGHGNGDYSGENLAPVGDVIVVTMNYRLGPLGFMALSELTDEDPSRPTSGNYGLEDQRMALEWVERNIAAFGGDPDNVMLFGESAGGISACVHLVSPESAGLFNRIAIQSGPCTLASTPLATAEAQGDLLATTVGCDTDRLACMRAKDASELLGALPNDPNLLSGNDTSWAPNVDGVILPEAPDATLEAGSVPPVPVLLGSNADEATLFLSLGGLLEIDEPTYESLAADYALGFGSDQATLLAAYPAADYATPGAALAAMLGHSIFNCPTRRMARQLSSAGNPTFLYHFTYAPDFQLLGAGLGAFHAAEVAFVFGTQLFTIQQLTPEEQPLVDAMMGSWTRFAATGDPNGAGITWPAYDAATDPHLTFALGDVTAGSALLETPCDFWDGLGP